MPIEVGGMKAVTLTRPTPSGGNQPRFVGADILPGRGMNIYQIRAYIPGKGVIDLIESPPIEEGQKLLNGGSGDEFGNQSFKIGGAILVPFANRIRGKLSPDGKTLATEINGKPIALPANWKGQKAGAEVHAIHGLILHRAMDAVTTPTANEQVVTGTLNAGNFEGHWVSNTQLVIASTLQPESFGFTVTAKNIGNEDLPMGIGWHPYFRLPSGNREQARLFVPARQRVLVDNYDNVFPTGKVENVAGTPYDFSKPGGSALGKLFLDDCFIDVQRNGQPNLVAEILDPAANYGLRIISVSPEISAFQAYAPVDKAFIAFEPQFNLGDPFSRVWKGRKTGMAVVKPGESVTYSVRLELFQPSGGSK